MTAKEFVNFPIKIDKELHEALRKTSFEQRISIHKLIQNTLKEKYTESTVIEDAATRA